ncbi:hypothetical protein [Mesorhizobium sp. CN2-181]|uniref:hypothetical protein n=1 Tax=Mesorhizobium yinganensis TaxID=3157707 RepID=UPI0032B77B5C
MNIHVDDPEGAGHIYAKVFGLEPILGMTKFNDPGVCSAEWTEWECEIPEGLITVRFVKKGTDDGRFPAKEFARLVNAASLVPGNGLSKQASQSSLTSSALMASCRSCVCWMRKKTRSFWATAAFG